MVNSANAGAITYTTTNTHASHTVNFTATGGTVNAAGSATAITVNGFATGASTYTSTGAAAVETYVGGTGIDTVTLGPQADTFTSGGGADVINIAAATDTSVAIGFNASSAIPAQSQAINVSGMDIINGFSTGASIVFTQTGATATSGAIAGNGGSLGAATTNDVARVLGTYNSSAGTFTIDTGGSDTLIAADTNGDQAGGSYVGVVLVGYSDTGGADTWTGAAGSSTYLAV